MSYSVAERDEKSRHAVELRAKQWSLDAIAEEIGVTRKTVTTWIENELSRRAEHRGEDRERHLAVYDAIQKEAWDAFIGTDPRSLNRSGYLNTIKAAEDSKMKITGAEAPRKYQNVGEDYEIVFDDDEIPAEVS
jgi:hypothetical protein